MQSDITMCFGKLNKLNIYDKTLNLGDYFKPSGLDNVHIHCTLTQTPNTQNTHKTPAPSPVKAAAYRLQWRVTQVPRHTHIHTHTL